MIPKQVYEETLRTLLAPVVPFLDDPSVSEVLINGPREVFVERKGVLSRTDASFDSQEQLMAALRNVAQFSGVTIDERRPILEARLPDGSRLEAITSPIAESGPSVAIRRFSRASLTLPMLIDRGAISGSAAQVLRSLTRAKANIVIAGGTGSGKTSLLNALAGEVPVHERMLVLEDTREIEVAHDHVVYLTARKADDRGQDAVSIRDLFRASLRMRPDRLVIGEIRGGEAMDLVQATVSGHGGCLSTLHASSPIDAVTRLETMCMMSDLDMPLPAIRNQLASGVDIIVQVARLPGGGRGVTHISELVGLDDARSNYVLRDLFVRRASANGSRDAAALVPTGLSPARLQAKLESHGEKLPQAMYTATEGVH